MALSTHTAFPRAHTAPSPRRPAAVLQRRSPSELQLRRLWLLRAALVMPLVAALIGFGSHQLRPAAFPAPPQEPVARGAILTSDGLALASELQPDAIVDVATLTGACIIALGERIIGVMGNDDELRDSLVTLGTGTGDTAWALPMPEEIRPTLDTPVADLKHTGERTAGAMVAATFLQEFVGTRGEGEDAQQIPWAHLDIAGPAFNEKAAWGYRPKGGTGAGVRSLIALAQSYTSSSSPTA